MKCWDGNGMLDRMINRGLIEKVTFGKDLKEVAESAMLIQEEGEEGVVNAKALRWKHGWHVPGTARRPVGLEWSERE